MQHDSTDMQKYQTVFPALS